MPHRFQTIPEVFRVSTLLRPVIWIRPLKKHEYTLEIDRDYQPTDVLPLSVWNKRVSEVSKRIQSRKTTVFTSFDAAYDFIWGPLNSFPAFEPKKLAIDPDISWDSTTSAVIGAKNSRFYINYANNFEMDSLLLEWEHFWKLNDEYQKSPKTFYYAYEWVVNHPMFWILRGDPEKDTKLYWETNDTFNIAWHSIFKSSNSNDVTHQFELGPNLCTAINFSKERTVCIPQSTPSLDINLDSRENTYEEAVISLAKNINAFYPLEEMDKWLYASCTHRPDIN